LANGPSIGWLAVRLKRGHSSDNGSTAPVVGLRNRSRRSIAAAVAARS